MDSCFFHSAETCQEIHRLFAFYHPQYQTEFLTYGCNHYFASLFDECENLGEPAHLSANLPVGFDSRGGFPFGSLEHDRCIAPEHAGTIPPAKLSTYSELMPHVVAHETTVSLKKDARAEAQPQACVSPALCQGHADLPECTESSDEEEDEEQYQSSPSPSPYSSPSSPSSDFSPSPGPSRVAFSARGKSRYSPMEVKAPSRKKNSAAQQVLCGPDDDEDLKKSKKRREAVSLACHFCRRRKIACKQPPPGSLDMTCRQCSTRGIKCLYPTESRRGARREATGSHEHCH